MSVEYNEDDMMDMISEALNAIEEGGEALDEPPSPSLVKARASPDKAAAAAASIETEAVVAQVLAEAEAKAATVAAKVQAAVATTAGAAVADTAADKEPAAAKAVTAKEPAVAETAAAPASAAATTKVIGAGATGIEGLDDDLFKLDLGDTPVRTAAAPTAVQAAGEGEGLIEVEVEEIEF